MVQNTDCKNGSVVPFSSQVHGLQRCPFKILSCFLFKLTCLDYFKLVVLFERNS